MFKRYIKENGNPNLQYWIDENGQDWYDYADNAETDTMKVLVDENNVVVDYNKDATTLYPNETSLFAVPESELPEDLDVIKYSYDGEKFYRTVFPEREETADEIKDKLFMLMLKNKMSAEDKKLFEELKEQLIQKMQK